MGMLHYIIHLLETSVRPLRTAGICKLLAVLDVHIQLGNLRLKKLYLDASKDDNWNFDSDE